MHFCSECDNMYYIRLTGENKDKLQYYCRKCGNEDDQIVVMEENLCVSKTDIKETAKSFENFINRYTKLDPTLPHITNINCPNSECISNKNSDDEKKTETDIIYLRYDDANMKFVYMCSHCNTVWKSADDK